MYNCYLGGKSNFPADRKAAEEVLRAAPEVRQIAVESRSFVERSVRFLVRDAGIRQVLDIGAGIPAAASVHEIARQFAPDVRVAYVDHDPVVAAHADRLRSGADLTCTVLADLREPYTITNHGRVRALIDFRRPIALLLGAILHFVSDEEDPRGIVRALRDYLPPGSYLALSHVTSDLRRESAAPAAAVYDGTTAAATLRSRAEIAAFFEGFQLVEPGLVQLPLWRPDHGPSADLSKIWVYGGVGIKS
jgi:S-adenosyl methyltransferase